MNWLIRFHLRNDTPQKWLELARTVFWGVILIVAGSYFVLWVVGETVEHFTP